MKSLRFTPFAFWLSSFMGNILVRLVTVRKARVTVAIFAPVDAKDKSLIVSIFTRIKRIGLECRVRRHSDQNNPFPSRMHWPIFFDP